MHHLRFSSLRLLVMLTACMLAVSSFSLSPMLAGASPARVASAPLTLGTYYGGSSDDQVNDVAVDSTGIYITGRTYSNNLPGMTGKVKGYTDMFVTKLSPDGGSVLWARLIGGRDDDEGFAIVADGQGNVYVTGSTDSDDFPVTPNADQPNFSGFTDITVMRLNASTGATDWATYLGTDNWDEGHDIALDGQGHVYVAGWWQQQDAVLLKYDAATGAGLWGKAWSNNAEGKANGLAIAPDGSIWVTGETDAMGTTSDFNVVGPALQTTCGAGDSYGSCGTDAFLTRFSPDGDIIYSSFFGGSFSGGEVDSGSDTGRGIAVDGQGNVYLVGQTFASNFPLKNAFQATQGGAQNFSDGFVSKIKPDGSAILYSTYLGGEAWDEARAITVDAAGNAAVTGYTGATDFPVKDALYDKLGNGICDVGGSERYCYDAFLTLVGPDGSLQNSTFLGGGLDELAYGMTRGADGAYYIVGETGSSLNQGFPITVGAVQTQKGLNDDGFVIRI
ncbi:MAG TPA: SBBP repeat-containing protein, partial [Roseiflexaceae bacterium]|nr:SBBP repeat-containing protein [Roseiflexaceae bacterium]